MKYVSIDIETSSLKPSEGVILSFGAVIEDTCNLLPLNKLPKFHVYIKHNEPIKGNYFALQMNSGILKDIATGESDVPIVEDDELELMFWQFLKDNKFQPEGNGKEYITITVAGKNFAGFDRPFIETIFGSSKVRFRKRVIDPAPLFTDFKTDEIPPDLKTCKERAGITGEVTHDALQDALDVIAVLRTKY